MKKLVVFIIILMTFGSRANAQVTTRHFQLNENTVVKDSDGTNYPYIVWQKLLSTGNYTLKAMDPGSDSSPYMLVKLSEAQKNAMMDRMPRPAESNFFTTGQKIKLFNVSDIQNKKVRLTDLKDKIIVLNFWFIGCPPCRQEIPELNKIALQYANDPQIIFVAVALDGKRDLFDFLKNNPFGYHIIDDGKEFADLYNINLYPTNVVLDKEGKVRFHGSGYAFNTAYWITKTIEQAKQTAPN